MWLLASQHNARESGRVIQRFPKTKMVIRIANAASENALNRSGVAARSTADSFTVLT
jgi:hypothetical protein